MADRSIDDRERFFHQARHVCRRAFVFLVAHRLSTIAIKNYRLAPHKFGTKIHQASLTSASKITE
jgi:hypothetical protein